MWKITADINHEKCSKCGKYTNLVKVTNEKTGKIQWRCSICSRKLNGGREFAHYELAPRNLEELRKSINEKSKKEKHYSEMTDMSEIRKPYPCPTCRSSNVRYDYEKGQSECFQCGNIWKANSQGVDLPYPCPKCGKNNVRYDFKGKQSECLHCGNVWKAEP